MGSAMIHYRPPAHVLERAASYRLRWEVLRAPHGEPRGSEQDDREFAAYLVVALDDADGTDVVVGTGRLHEVSPGVAQVRYMAIAPSHRGQGIGAGVLHALEAHAIAQGMNRIRLNARESATGFYTRHGYVDVGEGPTPWGIVHRVMEKQIAR